ncbi:hypothetical protein COCC4DRAFT_136656 [Bipolaris maydis ATCC 48331]|uniref:Uncharacterized protein n=2 Tax=Cochliobolus heterostrophus TaxID=5016 RepID=M2UT88_COCH5|nr:uncharacterized protein COCC4DRAFT_136656 [Bipolaris maydis ATCC 48331]EMD91098.1 hypothetical protein COCHEDRAFT_1103077 [Bipolaris maydis C5]ENI05820.1 hypothetical protein COCC4DRAFT_136656 [Bipolaris maydis ATCC 48331]
MIGRLGRRGGCQWRAEQRGEWWPEIDAREKSMEDVQMMRPEAWFMGRRDCNTLGLSCRSAWQYATLSLSIAF